MTRDEDIATEATLYDKTFFSPKGNNDAEDTGYGCNLRRSTLCGITTSRCRPTWCMRSGGVPQQHDHRPRPSCDRAWTLAMQTKPQVTGTMAGITNKRFANRTPRGSTPCQTVAHYNRRPIMDTHGHDETRQDGATTKRDATSPQWQEAGRTDSVPSARMTAPTRQEGDETSDATTHAAAFAARYELPRPGRARRSTLWRCPKMHMHDFL